MFEPTEYKYIRLVQLGVLTPEGARGELFRKFPEKNFRDIHPIFWTPLDGAGCIDRPLFNTKRVWMNPQFG